MRPSPRTRRGGSAARPGPSRAAPRTRRCARPRGGTSTRPSPPGRGAAPAAAAPRRPSRRLLEGDRPGHERAARVVVVVPHEVVGRVRPEQLERELDVLGPQVARGEPAVGVVVVLVVAGHAERQPVPRVVDVAPVLADVLLVDDVVLLEVPRRAAASAARLLRRVPLALPRRAGPRHRVQRPALRPSADLRAAGRLAARLRLAAARGIAAHLARGHRLPPRVDAATVRAELRCRDVSGPHVERGLAPLAGARLRLAPPARVAGRRALRAVRALRGPPALAHGLEGGLPTEWGPSLQRSYAPGPASSGLSSSGSRLSCPGSGSQVQRPTGRPQPSQFRSNSSSNTLSSPHGRSGWATLG